MLEKYHGNGVLLLGASAPNAQMIERALKITPTLYCADGGAAYAPIMPAAIIGDMDSFDEKSTQFQTVNKRLIEDQDTTDFEKCLGLVSAKFYICLGFTGGRMDHYLSSIAALAKFSDKKVFLVSETDFALVANARMCLELGEGVPFSLFPLETSRAHTAGLQWNLNGEDMAIGGLISTSNRTLADRVEVNVTQGKLAMILPNTHLETVITQLVD